ncbi:acetate/propionate family kinase [Mucilaginibacter sp. 44-25]|uniref:acetate/propionate family kinase n=1 Tax=Mucilaginibacter sp. 44-25 TaxID=1895794 RepID=UPI00095A3193|nr:acetate/propionate family kinase [Mucilaginibacter sp. 44-25]OJW15888.1 MAG: acetate kinase [Mucilaginibacter sp. 44-25]PMP65297.1 MAG: acetate/propionate family kinase [Mucilaginibacter sp.]HEK21406.1 acetate/propionate family kinase [Bacteroidota bacterium]
MTDHADNYLLTVNCGSSSLKLGLYELAELRLKSSASINGIGTRLCQFKVSGSQAEETLDQSADHANMAAAVGAAIHWLKSQLFTISAIGHRLVQGGPDHRAPELIGDELLKQLDEFVYLAPNHLPDELGTVKSFRLAFPGIPHLACFDTAFHKDLPSYIKRYALPEAYQGNGLIKYGFHGLSYEYIMQKLTADGTNPASCKIIIAHLGNGASMAAVLNGKCLDTTMGLSPIGGLVMATRSGDLDPGVILFLLKEYQLGVSELDELLSKKSGMIAIAGTGDMEELLTNEAIDKKAAEAIQVFCYQAKKQIGALAAAMGGLDILVFTGGIGANSPQIREHICRDLNFFGIELNQWANNKDQEHISLATSRVSVRALPTHEELMIAQALRNVLTQSDKN